MVKHEASMVNMNFHQGYWDGQPRLQALNSVPAPGAPGAPGANDIPVVPPSDPEIHRLVSWKLSLDWDEFMGNSLEMRGEKCEKFIRFVRGRVMKI